MYAVPLNPDDGDADPTLRARTERFQIRFGWTSGYCGAPTPVSVALSDEPSGNVTEPPLADNEPSRAR